MSGRRGSASQTAVSRANSSKPDGRQIEAGKTADRKRKGIKDWTQPHARQNRPTTAESQSERVRIRVRGRTDRVRVREESDGELERSHNSGSSK